jgi:hypothetical protein
MAKDLSPTYDPDGFERPSPAASLIIITVGPDPPERREAGGEPPGGRTQPGGQAQELQEDADGPGAHSQEGNRRDQLNR